jgi:hypothetical protein
VSLQAHLLHFPFLDRRARLQPAEKDVCESEPNVTLREIRSRDDTDLPICDRGAFKAPGPLQPILQMSAITQKPRRPATNDRASRGVSRSSVFAVQYGERTASGLKREAPVADQLTRERDDRGGMTDEQDPFVHPSKAPLYLGNKDGQKAPEAVVQGGHAFALAGRIPNRRPRIVDLGKIDLQGARGRRAREKPCTGFDGVVPLG